MRKYVERERLDEFANMLDDLLRNYDNGSTKQKITELQFYFDTYILETAKEKINQTKRNLYKNAKFAKDKETSEKYYALYQLIKEAEKICPEDEENHV